MDRKEFFKAFCLGVVTIPFALSAKNTANTLKDGTVYGKISTTSFVPVGTGDLGGMSKVWNDAFIGYID